MQLRKWFNRAEKPQRDMEPYVPNGKSNYGNGMRATALGLLLTLGGCAEVMPAKPPTGPPAKPVASYSNLHSSANRWYYDLVIKETNGVGVTLSHRERCFSATGCTSYADPVEKFGTNRIEPNGQVSATNRWFFTTRTINTMTETWYGKDDNSNSVSVSYSITPP